MKKGKNPSVFLKKILQRYKNRILTNKRIILLSKNIIRCMQSQESNNNHKDHLKKLLSKIRNQIKIDQNYLSNN